MEKVERLAYLMYDEYCAAVGGKAFNGDDLPVSTEFFNDVNKTKQANAWRSAAKVAIDDIAMHQLTFQEELQQLLNRHSKENGSNTPDFILMQYTINCLDNFDMAVNAREKFHGRGEPEDGSKLGKF